MNNSVIESIMGYSHGQHHLQQSQHYLQLSNSSAIQTHKPNINDIKTKQYQKFKVLKGKNSKAFIRKQIHNILQSNDNSYEDERQFDLLDNQISQTKSNSNKVTVMEMVKKYGDKNNRKRMYDLLPTKQKIMRDYLAQKKKSASIIKGRQQKQLQIIVNWENKKKQFQRKNIIQNMMNQQKCSVQSPKIVLSENLKNQLKVHKGCDQLHESINQNRIQPLDTPRNVQGKRFIKNQINQSDTKKFEVMIKKNNQYFQQLHHSIVNRLLDIIESNQNSVLGRSQIDSAHVSMVQQFQNTRMKSSNKNQKVIQNSIKKELNFRRNREQLRDFNKENQEISKQNRYITNLLEQSHKKHSEHSGSKQIIINNIFPFKKTSKLNSNENSHQKQEKRILQLQAQKHRIQTSYTTPRASGRLNLHRKGEKGNTTEQTSYIKQHQQFSNIIDKKQNQFISISQQPLEGHKRRRQYNRYRENNIKGHNDHKYNLNDELYNNNNQKLEKQLISVEPNKNPIQNSITNTLEVLQNKQKIEGVQIIQSERISHISTKKNSESIIETEKQKSLQTQKIKKDPVYIEIPIQQSSYQGMSLAEAFSKKLGGKLPSQRRKNIEKQSPIYGLSYQGNQMQSLYKNFDEQSISKKKPFKNIKKDENKGSKFLKKKQNPLKNLSEKKQGKTNMKDKDEIHSIISKQPSEQLINRLIGGSKAKVPKKQMYALTKKNYQNLPEVKAKRKEEQKKELERSRLQKIKQYQKGIRKSTKSVTHSTQ